MLIPRFLLAAPSSSSGKTTVSVGIMAALARRGLSVAPFKVGPDYIDPGYHALATGRPGRNLDAVMCGRELIEPLFLHGAAGADVAVIEGVMGLFDGQLGTRGHGSSAQIAKLLGAPVVLVLDIGKASRTHAAVVAGLDRFDPELRIAGVILNKVGSARHGDEVAAGLAELGIPVLGRLPRTDDIQVPSRHLGLIPAAERPQAAAQLDQLAAQVEQHIELDALLKLGAGAPALEGQPWSAEAVVSPVSGRPRIAMAGGRAFTFRYAETAELLLAAGCEVVEFDPLVDAALPVGTTGLYLGGGFPEVHADELSANQELLADIRAAAQAGLPIVAECAGLLYLCQELDGHPMTGVIQTSAAMGKKLTMGYRQAVAPADSLLTRAGEQVMGHEFHRTQLAQAATDSPAWLLPDERPDGAAGANLHASYLHLHWAAYPQLAQRFAQAAANYSRNKGTGSEIQAATTAGTGSVASQVTEQVAADSQPTRSESAVRATAEGADSVGSELALADTLANNSQSAMACSGGAVGALDSGQGSALGFSGSATAHADPAVSATGAGDVDLLHHGDADLVPGTVDFAVNVSAAEPPSWLIDEVTRQAGDWAAYPNPARARAALAAHHGVAEEQLLPTAGAAEAFALLARAFSCDLSLLGEVSESDISCGSAVGQSTGVSASRIQCDTSVTLDNPAVVPLRRAVVVHPQFTEPEAALRLAGVEVERHILAAPDFQLVADQVPVSELVIIGNPTNPTGVLHPAVELRKLLIPGRIVVVDEAFMDATDESESLIGGPMTGLIVLRSLTKTYAIAGIRAGYAVGDPMLIKALAAQQSPWSVSTPAIAAMQACCSPAAKQHAAEIRQALPVRRAALIQGLQERGLKVAGEPVAPFVLVDTSPWGSQSLREPLARLGIATRRGETFPGLGPTWLRLAVRDYPAQAQLFTALDALRNQQ